MSALNRGSNETTHNIARISVDMTLNMLNIRTIVHIIIQNINPIYLI